MRMRKTGLNWSISFAFDRVFLSFSFISLARDSFEYDQRRIKKGRRTNLHLHRTGETFDVVVHLIFSSSNPLKERTKAKEIHLSKS